MVRGRMVMLVGALAGCGSSHHGLPDAPVHAEDSGGPVDTAGSGTDAVAGSDGPIGDGPTGDGPTGDAAVADAVGMDGPTMDALVTVDAVAHDAGATTVITGGPCLSGAPGATAYRIRWADGGGTAYPVYEVDGLPDHSRDHAGAYGYQIGFTPSFVDPFLGVGGLQLDGSDFIDLEITTVGVANIAKATLAIYGRSYNTTASGSFDWQTFVGTGSTPTDLVSNVAPYQWYAGDMTTEIHGGDAGVLIRVKAGLSSEALVVNRIELCLQD